MSLFAGKHNGWLALSYVPGNHDFMVQLSPRLRAIVCRFLSLDHDAAKPFPLCHIDHEASVYATHGHASDPLNWHRDVDGYWAIGDAIVLRVVNRFAEDACQALGLTPTTQLGQLVADVENVEPIADIPIYIRWVADMFLTEPSSRTKLLGVWKNVVEEFLALPEFNSSGHQDRAHSNFRMVLGVSTSGTLTDLLSTVAAKFGSGGPDYRAEAVRLRSTGSFRFVVFGHTHNPGMHPLGLVGGKSTFYVNTGCWRRVVSRAEAGAAPAFVPRRLVSRFEVDVPRTLGDDSYRLVTEWSAN